MVAVMLLGLLVLNLIRRALRKREERLEAAERLSVSSGQ